MESKFDKIYKQIIEESIGTDIVDTAYDAKHALQDSWKYTKKKWKKPFIDAKETNQIRKAMEKADHSDWHYLDKLYEKIKQRDWFYLSHGQQMEFLNFLKESNLDEELIKRFINNALYKKSEDVSDSVWKDTVDEIEDVLGYSLVQKI